MTCLKACPHRSVEFNLRPPGIELWTTHQPRSYEVALLLLLLGGVFLHRLPEIAVQLDLNLPLNQFWPHAGVSVAVLVGAAIIPLWGHGLLRLIRQGKQRPFIELAYGYLPLVLGGTLAHYLQMGLSEAGQILPVAWATIGLKGSSLPGFSMNPATIAFLQGAVLIVALILTWIVTRKISRQAFRNLWPQHLTAFGLTICLWSVIVGA
jgi:polyferredoxin